jgi:hypothetical protein
VRVLGQIELDAHGCRLRAVLGAEARSRQRSRSAADASKQENWTLEEDSLAPRDQLAIRIRARTEAA